LTSISFAISHPAFDAQPRTRYAGLAMVVALHLAGLAAWWQYAPAREALARTAPILVHLIMPPVPPQVPPPSASPKPRTLRVAAPPPRIESPVTAPMEMATPITLTQPAAAIVAFDPAPIAPTPPAPTVATPMVEPSFAADYLRNPAPAYPSASRRNGEQGTVLLRVLVNIAGDAAQVEIQRSSGFERLDDAARAAVRRWKFVPGRRGGEPVAAWVIVPLAFSLTS
jgi:protein TonB